MIFFQNKQYTPTNDYWLDLQNFAAIQGLEEPRVKVIPRKSRKTTILDCSIKVNWWVSGVDCLLIDFVVRLGHIPLAVIQLTFSMKNWLNNMLLRKR